MKTMKVLSMAAVALLISVASYAQTADEVIAKYLENTGGKAKWEALKSVKTTGKIKVQGMELPVTIAQKAPNKQMTLAEFQGMKFYQNCFDGTTGWNTNQMTMKAEKMEAEDSENMKDQSELLDPFINYAARGYKVSLEGKETVEGTECFKIKLVRKPLKVEGKDEENSSFYFFDTQNYVPILVQSTIRKGPAKGMVSETVMSDYQEVNGLFFPFAIIQRAKGQPGGAAIVIEKVEVNVDMDDKQFAMPEEKTPEVKK
jgi:outer membrane lipoprotein-sorting protein